MKKIAFYTLGCKVNQADTASMEEMFRKAGYQIVPFDEQSDVYLINTCVVTNTGQRKSKQIINRAVRKNPSALTVVTGCYPQTAADEVKKIDGVDIIIGNQERSSVVKLVEQAMDDKRTQILDNVQSMTVSTKFEELAAGLVTDRTRAFLKIQEGCNQYCSFCIIPYARGPLRSRSLAGIKEEASKLAAAGYKEIVLLGIHLGCYGKESGGAVSLCDAVEAVLEVEGISRIRLGSLESVEVDTRLLELMAKEPRICRHLHLPLQSGSDRILAAMRRPYTTERFKTLLNDIRTLIPDVEITTDVIVGFPGETSEDFEATLQFAEACGFSKMHIFPYSKRQGTPAAEMPEQVEEKIKQRRAERLAELDRRLHKKALANWIGREAYVQFEQSFGEGRVEGLCGAYLRVVAKGDASLCGSVHKVRLVGDDGEHLLADITD